MEEELRAVRLENDKQVRFRVLMRNLVSVIIIDGLPFVRFLVFLPPVDNKLQKAMIAKFRERWERLKESAKRKKSAKAAGQSDSVRERIDEDPEAEEAAEESSRNGS